MSPRRAAADLESAVFRFARELNRPFVTTEALMTQALRLFCAQLPVDRVCAFELDAPNKLLRLQLSSSQGVFQELDEEIHLPETSPFTALLEGAKPDLMLKAPHAVFYVPLRAESRTTGVLRLERFARGFSAGDRRLAARLAQTLAQSSAQVELVHRSLQKLKRLEALTELAAIFASSLRVDDGLRIILQGIQRHFTLDRVRLYLVDRAHKTLRGELSVDLRGGVKSMRSEQMPLVPGEHRFVDLVLGDAVTQPAAKTSEVKIRNQGFDPDHPVVLHVPLVVQNNGTGLLVMDNLVSQQPIDREDIRLLRSFAGQIALAVDNSRLFDEVQALSLYDGLTGLPVRRLFNQRFQEEIYRAERSGQPVALALMDVDYFKVINDTYGHQIGDATLQAIGHYLSSSLRKIDLPCRYGGDEIVVLLPQADADEASRIMERIGRGIKSLEIAVPFSKAGKVGVSTSVGISVYPSDGRELTDLIQKADEALYRVKSKGRDGVLAYSKLAFATRPA